MSRMKPMSSMRSASSSTRISTAGKIQRLLPDMVEQPSGRGHEDIDLPAQCFHLRIDVHAAEHHHRFQRQIFAVGLHRFFHLCGEFACRDEDQAARTAGTGIRCRLCGQQVQDRQRETRGLAGAGLRAGQQIAAGQYQRDRLGLHRGGCRVTRIGNRAHQGLCQI